MDPRRRRPPLDLAENPLVFVLAQVVMSPILQMENYIPGIQERLRRNGFPGFVQSESREVKLGPEVEVVARTRWVFSHASGETAIVLSPEFAVIEQVAYTSFDDLVSILELLLEVVTEELEPAFSERLGLRRVNLLEPGGGLTLHEFVKPGLRGLSPRALGVESLESRLEERGQTAVGHLVVRLLQPAPATVVPADLTATTLDIRQPRISISECAILDIDHYSTTTRDYNPGRLIDSFWDLHEYSDLAFREAVTEGALEHWRAGTDSTREQGNGGRE